MLFALEWTFSCSLEYAEIFVIFLCSLNMWDILWAIKTDAQQLRNHM